MRRQAERRGQNICLAVAYDGGGFCGWQRVENAKKPSIQGTLEGVLSESFGRAVRLSGAGRTDAGVHALGQVANAFVPCGLWREHGLDWWLREWNSRLPGEVRIQSVREVRAGFHSRYSAVGKQYCYLFDTREVPSVFLRRYAFACGGSLDVEAMRRAAAFLLGEHDFTAFASVMEEGRGTVRRIDRLEFITRPGVLRLEVSGNGFLYHMVRILAGTLYEVGIGEREPESILQAEKSGNRQDAGRMLPGQGLFLEEVFYEE